MISSVKPLAVPGFSIPTPPACANAVATQGIRHVGKASTLELIDLHLRFVGDFPWDFYGIFMDFSIGNS